MSIPMPRPLYLATLFAGLLALLIAVGGYFAIEHERAHMRRVIEDSSTADSRWAYALLTEAIDPLLETRSAAGALPGTARAAIDDLVLRIAARTAIVKVSIFDATGERLYSRPAAADEPRHDTAALQAARAGRVSSETQHHASFVGIKGALAEVDVIGTYFPHYLDPVDAEGRPPDVVVETYVDITASVKRAEHEFRTHAAVVLAALVLLYLLIVGAVLWGARALSRMERLQQQAATSAIRSQRQLREAKQRAEEKEEFLQEAIRSMEYGFLLLDPEKRVLFWNQRYLELLPPVAPVLRRGAALRELIAALAESPLYAIPQPEREQWVELAVPRLWDGQAFRRRLASGRTLRIALMPTRDGGRILSLQDMTADVVAEERMARLALVAENTDNAVVIAAADGAVEWVNAGFMRITGHDGSEVVGRPLVDALDLAELDTEARARIRDAVAGGTSFDAELRSRTKAGVAYWLQLASTPVRDDKGRVTRHVVIASDVTTRKDQERRLAEALARERELVAQQKRFVAIAAHELRTPLTIIDGAAQRLARNADRITPEDLRDRAERIRGGVTRLAELVDTTLNSVRLDEGRIELNLSRIDLRALIAGVSRRLTGLSSPIQVAIAAVEPVIEIEADPRLLDQVFTNLISNAMKYSGAGRRIEISLTPREDEVLVAVRDSGIGIPAAELPNLFERFYRASTAKSVPGTGIGLHLARELVSLHGGSIAVESRIGEGSVFTVTLPRRRRPSRDAGP